MSNIEEKTIYYNIRKEVNLTREEACELMDGINEDKLKRIENGTQIPDSYDILQMAEVYKKPELCNWHCTHNCQIGNKYIPIVEISELPSIVLGAVSSLNEMQPMINTLIQISKDGKITDDELKDFAFISKKLDEISLASDALTLWIERTIKKNELNGALFYKEKERLGKE